MKNFNKDYQFKQGQAKKKKDIKYIENGMIDKPEKEDKNKDSWWQRFIKGEWL